jgi:4-hydroxy-2-oxoheptanedioate aldolase
MSLGVKEKIAAGEIVTIVNVNFSAAALVERLGALGFDVVFIDCEKGNHTTERIEDMARAGRAADVATIARPWANDAGLISRYLDLGVDGIMLPTIETADEARRLVEAVRYARYQDHADKLVIATVESPQGVENLPGLLAVDGIDMWSIGINDLAHRMGFPGRPSEAAVQRALTVAIERIVAAGKACATVATRENSRRLVDQGVRGLITNVNALLALGAAEYSAGYR